MQTHYSRTRDHARDFLPSLMKQNVDLQPRDALLKIKASLPSVPEPSSRNQEFSPLIQEFLDECGYSDR